ncbi:hypothetical protein HHK36_024799 [Tetracentron sinense]|uniref:Uncharacterized protein n=1 Tax=Tetracentron sinense TaxID=13715 RepID=A0A835D7U2_TETSI|nr:hypothetical protein HHK36_024799 [Tetracentron sinense]
MEVATRLPCSSWMSAITTTRAPLLAKRCAVASPIPLAPPVMITTFPSSRLETLESHFFPELFVGHYSEIRFVPIRRFERITRPQLSELHGRVHEA